MVFKLLIKPIVFFDAEEAVDFYTDITPALGKRFYHQFLKSLEQIEVQPLPHSYLKPPIRSCKIEHFPYKIFYITSFDRIIIIGLSHAKRSNAFVKRRLKSLK